MAPLDGAPSSLYNTYMNQSGVTADPEDCGPLLFALMHAGQDIEAKIEGALAGVGLSLAKFGVLAELVRSREPVTLSELASRLSCVRSNMTQLIDRLEADGLVKRVDDPADRRTVRAALTPTGKTQHAAGERAMTKVQGELSARIPRADRGQLDRILAAIK